MGERWHLSEEERRHPDRRQRRQHTRDRRDAGPQPVQHQPGDQAQTWFPSNENESYRPYRPKRLKAGPSSRHRQPTAGDPSHESPTGCRTTACGRRWPNGWAAAGRRCPSAAMRVLWPDDALMRVVEKPMGRPAGRFGNAGRGACREGNRHGGRRTSRFPIPGRVPISIRHKAIGRPTRHRRRNQRHTEARGRPGSSTGRSGTRPAPGGATFATHTGRTRVRHARQRHRVRPVNRHSSTHA